MTTPGHPVMEFAGYNCQCGECLAREHAAMEAAGMDDAELRAAVQPGGSFDLRRAAADEIEARNKSRFLTLRYKDYYSQMSLADFTAWVAALAAGTATLASYAISEVL